MKAMVCTKYGPPDVLESTEVEIPAPQDDEVLVTRPCGLRQPRRLAHPARRALHRPPATRATKTEGEGSGLRCGGAGRSGRQERHDVPAG